MAAIGPYLAACLLLVGAGVAKARRPADTARALQAAIHRRWPRVRLPAWPVRAFAALEALVGLAAAADPTRGLAVAVAASYAAFTAFLLVARVQGGPLATCGCFGTPDTPPTWGHVGVDVAAVAAAIAVAVSPAGDGVLGGLRATGHPVVVAALSVLLVGLSWMVLVPLARLEALRAHRPAGA